MANQTYSGMTPGTLLGRKPIRRKPLFTDDEHLAKIDKRLDKLDDRLDRLSESMFVLALQVNGSPLEEELREELSEGTDNG